MDSMINFPNITVIQKQQIKIMREELNNIEVSSRHLKTLFTFLLITYITMISVIPFMIPLYSILLTLVSLVFLLNEVFYYEKKQRIKCNIENILINNYEEDPKAKEINFWSGFFQFENLIYLLGFFPLFLALLNLVSMGLL